MKISVIIIAALSPACAFAAPLSLDSCVQAVARGNLSLAAERLNVPIAVAEERAASVFNDPTLGFEYANNDDRRMQMGQSYSVELGYTLSPGKRAARRSLAAGERELAGALLDAELQSMRLEAATSYFDLMRAEMLNDVAQSMARSMADIARGDSLGAAIGQVRPVDASATRIAARVAAAEAAAATAEMHNARLALATLMGCPDRASEITTDTAARTLYPAVNAAEAADMAVERRADLRAAVKTATVAERQLRVEKAERKMEFELALGYNYNTEVRNEIAPAPRFGGISVGVTVPLKFSNSNKGAITAARLRHEQARLQAEAAALEVRSRALEAAESYAQARAAWLELDESLMLEARSIYNAYIDSYRHGDVSLVELMDMRERYAEVVKLHIDARRDVAVAYATLRAACGL